MILENLKKLFELNVKIWIRIPVISGVNDSLQEMQNIKNFLFEHGKPEKIELLPYHAMGENKYVAIGKVAQHFVAPTDNALSALKAVF